MGVLFISLPGRERLYVCIMVTFRLNSPEDQLKLSVSKYTESGGFAKIKGFQIIIGSRAVLSCE